MKSHHFLSHYLITVCTLGYQTGRLNARCAIVSNSGRWGITITSTEGASMATILTIQDERLGGQPRLLTLSLPAERLTVRELIRERVYQEVKDYNTRQPEYFQGLVQPSATEQTLNGYRLKTPRQINWEEQFEKAVQAFQRNGFIILVNDQQLTELDQVIEVGLTPEVSFLKLIPLVGG